MKQTAQGTNGLIVPVLEQEADRCEAHQAQLKKKSGFTFNYHILADPSWDYVRFMDDERFPHTTGWHFSSERTEHTTKPTTVVFCPICDAEFTKGYADFRRLTEEKKEALFVESLRKEAQKKKQNKPVMAKPSKPSDQF